jgi:hypothetical protein
MPRRTFHTQTVLEALLVEQALLLARRLQKTADDESDGRFSRPLRPRPSPPHTNSHGRRSKPYPNRPGWPKKG